MIRVGLVGTGFGGRMMAPALAATPGVEIVEVVSAREVESVRRLCARRDLDLVSVHSPPFLHVRDVELALENSSAVLVDKPFGVDADQASELLRTVRAAGALHIANLEFRCESWRLMARDLITSGVLGDIETVDWSEHSNAWRRRRGGWQLDADCGGGWLAASVSHTLDTLRWLLGDLRLERARLWARRPIADDDPHTPAEDTVEVSVRAEDGALCRVRACAVESCSVPARILIAGSAAALERTSQGRLMLHGAAWPADLAAPEPQSLTEVLAQWCVRVRDAVRTHDTSSVPTLEDGLVLRGLMDEIRSAAAT